MSGPTSREDVSFRSAGVSCAAWLYRPEGDGSHPCVVLAHGFAGVREARLDAFAERFAQAGFAALVFDYRHFGGSDGQPRQLLDVGRQQEDWRAAVNFVRAHEGIDPDRVAVWGTSLSGAHVMALAASGELRPAAVISQCPAADAAAAVLQVPFRNSIRLAIRGIRDLVAGWVGRGPIYTPAIGAPGTLAAMTAPEALPGYSAIVPADWRNEFASRLFLTLALYRPVTKAARIEAPMLVCVCDRDQTTPPEPAAKAAARAPRGRAVHYDCGHFDIYVGEWFERAVSDQIAFLKDHVGAATDPADAAAR